MAPAKQTQWKLCQLRQDNSSEQELKKDDFYEIVEPELLILMY